MLIAPPGGATAITAMGDLGGYRHDSLTEVPAGRLQNPMMTTSTGIDFAQSNPAVTIRVGRGGAQDGAYSTDGGRTFTTLTTVQSASALGFGKAAPGATYQSLYLIGTVKDVTLPAAKP